MKDFEYKVHIQCTTYNHAPYIEDAMNGFCMQQTDFPFICTIIDDASTDGEPEVIKKYLEEHFILDDKAVARKEETDDYYLIYAQHKINKNCFFTILLLKYNHYKTKKDKKPYLTEWSDNTVYRAYCEGDDYWIDSLKLQKQIDFLEAHQDYGCIGSVCKSFVQKEQRFYEAAQKKEQEITFEDLLFDTGFATCTAVIRTNLYEAYIHDIEPKWKMGDYPMWLYYAANSRVYRLSDVTAVYRVILGSASHPTDGQTALAFKLSSMDCTNFFIEKYGLAKDKRVKLIQLGADNLFQRGVSLKYKPFIEEAVKYRKVHSMSVPLKYYLFLGMLSTKITKLLLQLGLNVRGIIKKDILHNVKR